MMNQLKVLEKKNEKSRNPNIDFIRIIGMYAIIIHHLLIHGKAILKYKNYNGLKLLNILFHWHVSSFGITSGLTSGLCGSKTFKFSNLFYLYILVVFYSLIFYFKFNKLNILPLHKNRFISHLFPVIHVKYWYFTTYFGIYPFLPIINKGISILSLIEIKKIIHFMFVIFIILVSYNKDCFYLHYGYSPFSLLILYVFGAYIGRYIFFIKRTIFIRIFIYIVCIIIFMSASLISYNINIKHSFPNISTKLKNLFKVGLISFPVISQVFSIILFSSQINFNEYISNIITFLGPLTFDIYLIHENQYIRIRYISNSLSKLNEKDNLLFIFFSIFSKSFFIFIICIFISYVRSIIFKLLKIKSLCIIFESIINKIIIYFL